jgi:hypothetical protein
MAGLVLLQEVLAGLELLGKAIMAVTVLRQIMQEAAVAVEQAQLVKTEAQQKRVMAALVWRQVLQDRQYITQAAVAVAMVIIP